MVGNSDLTIQLTKKTCKTNKNATIIDIYTKPLNENTNIIQGDEAEFAIKINPFPNKPWFLRVCSTSLLKTLWEKEKLLVTSNFSFSHSVFYLF